MLRIAICDDDKNFLDLIYNKVTELCYENSIEFDLKCFSSPMETLKEQQINKINLLFLDIDMPDMNGFELANQIQEINPQIYLIFVTSKNELVYQSLQYHPYFFIRKTHLYEELSRQIIDVNNIIKKKEKQKIIINSTSGAQKISTEEIMYIENNKNYVQYILSDRVVTARKSISDVELELEKYGFARVHAGFIVNLSYIEKFNSKEITLKNGDIIPISRNRKDRVKNIIMGEIFYE